MKAPVGCETMQECITGDATLGLWHSASSAKGVQQMVSNDDDDDDDRIISPYPCRGVTNGLLYFLAASLEI